MITEGKQWSVWLGRIIPLGFVPDPTPQTEKKP
jgi:hypothetical protein